jgi:RHS repeat-associated protein
MKRRNFSGAATRHTSPNRFWSPAVLLLAALVSHGIALAEKQWTNALVAGPWPNSTAACVNGEVEPRIAALRAANPSIQYRYRTLVVNEYLPDQESECDYVIERRVGIAWIVQEMGPRTHLQTGAADPCPEGTVDSSGYCRPKNAGPAQCPDNGSNPIDSATANKYQQEADYKGAGHYPLVFIRHYNSLSKEAGVLGRNWRHHYQRSVVVTALSGDAPTQVKIYRADGKRYDFNLVSGTWRPDADVSFQLQRLLTSGNPSGWRLTTDADDVEVYDARGRLSSITPRSGQRHTLTYDASSRLASVRDTDGRQLTLAYDANSRVATITDPASQTITFSYDASNRLQTATYPDTTSRTYVYNEPSLTSAANLPWALTGIVDESASRFASFGYDTQGRAISSQHAGGAGLVSVSYGAGGVRTVTDSLSAARTFTYTTILNTARNTGVSQSCNLCGGAAQSLAYDANGNVSSRTDFNGNVSVHTHDLARNLETSRTEANGSAVARTITTAWHASFRLPTQIDEPGRRTTFTHNATGSILTRTVTDLTVVPNISRTWTYTYDTAGRMLTSNGPRTDVSDVTTYTYYSCTTGSQCGQVHTITNALGHVATYNSYNAHGQPLTITDANGLVTTLTYDLRQRLASRTVGTETTTFTYHPTGLLRRITLPDGSYIEHTYDAAHRLTRIEDGEGHHIVYTLDAMGNRTAEQARDPSNTLARTRSWVYNSLNRLTQEIGAAGTAPVTTSFGHDNNGNETSINAPLARNTALSYDALNRLGQITDPLLGATQYGYNALDQLLSVTDPRGKVTSYTYNAHGDLTQLVSPDTGTTVNTYDSGGNPLTSTDARSKTGTYAHDALNRVTSLTYPDQTITYTYDTGTNQKGRLTQVSDASGSTSWTYDAHGKVSSRQQSMGITKTLSYAYDASGRLQTLTLPSGATVGHAYTHGRLTSLTLNGVTTVLSNVLYEPFGATRGWTWGNATLAVRQYNLDGNVTDIDSAGLKTYGYDDAFRVTSVTDVTTPSLSQSYGYDLLDRLTSATGTGLNQSWTYDASGNRLSQGGSHPSSYTVSATSNRIASITGTLSRTYGHDAAGNATGDGAATLTYNDAGRLVSATRGGITATYAHNALGQRVKKTVTGVTTYFVYDEAGHLVGEYDGTGALIQETLWFDDLPVAVLKPNGSGGVNVFYVHTDHLDTPRRISRPSDNAILWRWDSDPFGTTAANEDPDGDTNLFNYHLRFPGQYLDQETGLHYNYQRDAYDPGTGRYSQADPEGLSAGPNPYVYALNNPLIFVDPLGLTPQACPTGPPPKDDKCKKPPRGLKGWARILWLAWCLMEGKRPPETPPPRQPPPVEQPTNPPKPPGPPPPRPPKEPPKGPPDPVPPG